jgi:hypothetical protein
LSFTSRMAARRGSTMENVLDCAVNADKLLGMAKEKVTAVRGSTVLAETLFFLLLPV